jgi:phage shock protein C
MARDFARADAYRGVNRSFTEVEMTDEVKRLYRSRDDRMIAGVCAGLGEYFGVDPTVVRRLAVGGAFINPPGAVIAYLLVALVVPSAPLDEPLMG